MGTVNLFMFIRGKDGKTKELVAAPIDDGTILEGVVRDSVLTFSSERLLPDENWIVSERWVMMPKLALTSAENCLLEVFGTGTAVVICPVRSIRWKGRDLGCGLADGEEVGWMEEVQYGMWRVCEV